MKTRLGHLNEMLEQIVADMDVEVFEPIRKGWAAGQDLQHRLQAPIQ